MTDKPTPSERLEAESWSRRAERELREQIESQEAELKELRSLSDFYNSARTEPIVVPEWRRPAGKTGKNVGIQMAQMADWHLDEVVKPEQILGLNAYNRQIAMRRIQSWAAKVVTLPRDYMSGLEIQGLVIPSTGDLFSGEIHAELKETNEDKILSSLLYWMEPIIAMLEMFSQEYPGVEVDAVPGNHPRTTEKYNHKNRVLESYESFFWAVVRDRLADRGKAKNVVVNVSPSANMNIDVYGRNYLLDHGYEFKGGTGIAGAFSPLSLGAHRKNLRQAVADMPMHTMIVGHLHQMINIPGVIMGSTLKGYDEFAFNHNLRPDENGAGQAMWITSPERAQVLWMPIYVQDRAEEGW